MFYQWNQIESIYQQKIPETIADNFEFKSVRTPPKNEHLNALEDDCSIKFIVVSSKFQRNLSKDIKVINKDPVLFITAEKRFLSAFEKNY